MTAGDGASTHAPMMLRIFTTKRSRQRTILAFALLGTVLLGGTFLVIFLVPGLPDDVDFVQFR